MAGHSHLHGDHGHHHDAGDGPVVVDIGDGVGALVLHTPAEMAGAEIEISRVGEPRTGKHVAVHPRRIGEALIHAAVYGDLTEGRWQLWAPSGDPGPVVTVVGGEVVERWWPQAA